jgi:hypothetical protein
MSIAGGDPLVHPKIVDIVRMVKEGGWKPIINTNGLAMTPALLKKLKEAGAFGFTFHVDTSQKRRDSKADSEEGHNVLRQRFAEMLAEVGGLSCAFNQTVTSDTLDQVPDIVNWARKRPDIVHSVVFILYREPRLFGNFEFWARGKRVPLETTYEKTITWGGDRALKAPEVVEKIREAEPSYEPCAYLNGTHDPNSAKWLIGTRVACGEDTLGYVGGRFMELVQQSNRVLKGKWLAYSSPGFLRSGKSAILAMGTVDPRMRKIGARYLRHIARNPLRVAKPACFQTISIIQPIDVLEDGRMNMCDGCPDITVHKGKLYWSCRLEEIKTYGCFVSAAPKKAEKPSRESVEHVISPVQ